MKFPVREAVLKVYELKEEGKTGHQIAQIVGCSRDQAARWLKNPEKYSPFIDGVAVERALRGDRKVFDALTIFELAEMWKQSDELAARSDWDVTDGIQTNLFLANLARGLGMSTRQLSDLRLQAARMRERQAKAGEWAPGKLKEVLTDDDVRAIRKAYVRGKTTLNSVGAMYKVSGATISRIISGERHSHVV